MGTQTIVRPLHKEQCEENHPLPAAFFFTDAD